MNKQKQPDVIYADMVVTRVLDAPVEAVWEFWTVPEKFQQWWAPEGFVVSKAEMDVRVGGSYLWCMRGPEGWGGKHPCNTGTFSDVVPHRLLRYSVKWADDRGNVLTAAEMGMDYPDELVNQVTFEALPDDRTIMTITEYGAPLNQMFAYGYAGLNEGIDKMVAALKKG